MLRMFLPMLLIALFAPAHGQAAPDWVKECSAFSNEWYCGYGASNADAMGKMVNQILVNIKSEYSREVEQTMTQRVEEEIKKSETIIQTDRQKIEASTGDVKVVGTKFYTHPNGTVYAAVKKKDLANFYRSNINSLFAFAEKEFAIIEQLAEQGKKKQALEKIPAVEDSLKNVGYWASLLRLVENDNSYMAKEKDFTQKAGGMKMRFQNATSVYLDISGDDDLSRLSAQMQEKGCNCNVTEEKEKAEYLVAVKTKLSRCNGESSTVFCYANATVTVNNLKSQKPVNVSIPEAKGGWVKGDKEKAAEEAFKKLTSSLAEKINQTLNQ